MIYVQEPELTQSAYEKLIATLTLGSMAGLSIRPEIWGYLFVFKAIEAKGLLSPILTPRPDILNQAMVLVNQQAAASHLSQFAKIESYKEVSPYVDILRLEDPNIQVLQIVYRNHLVVLIIYNNQVVVSHLFAHGQHDGTCLWTSDTTSQDPQTANTEFGKILTQAWLQAFDTWSSDIPRVSKWVDMACI